MEIRRARPDDAPAIAGLEALCFDDPWGVKDIFSYICRDSGMCFCAVDDSGVIGYVLGQIIPPEAEIYRIAVSPQRRQRGIGYRLLSFALKTERGRGLETTFLEVRSKNAPARALYRAHGFKEVSVRKNYYKNPVDDAIIMVLDKSDSTAF